MKIHKEVICDSCNTKFTTEKPTIVNVQCKCGAIMCDVTSLYIRTSVLIENAPFTYLENGIKIIPK